MGAPPDRVTAQGFDPAPVIETLVHETELRETTPAPLILMMAFGEADELLVILILPV